MAFAVKKKNKDPRPPKPQNIFASGTTWLFARTLLVAACAIVACAYALVRYYTVPLPPMFVPKPAASSAAPAPSATEIEISP